MPSHRARETPRDYGIVPCVRCAVHDLAAGPGGECVMCLRSTRVAAQRRAVWLSAGFVVSVLLACGVVLASRSLQQPVLTPVAELRLPTPEPPRAAATVSDTPQAPALEPTVAQSAAAAEPTDAPPAPSSLVAVAAPATSARVPSKQEVQTALRATPVLMFSTTWCPHCDRARRFFQANGMRVTDRDVEADLRAGAELKRRTGGKGVPLIEVDGQQLSPGFSEQATMQAVAFSVARRLGVSGLQLVPAVAN